MINLTNNRKALIIKLAFAINIFILLLLVGLSIITFKRMILFSLSIIAYVIAAIVLIALSIKHEKEDDIDPELLRLIEKDKMRKKLRNEI